MNNIYDLFNLIGKNMKTIRTEIIGKSRQKN